MQSAFEMHSAEDAFKAIVEVANTLPQSNCKGQVFKGYNSTFSNFKTGRIERRQGTRFMKSLSCPGCEDCGGAWMLDEVQDHIDCDTLLMPEIEHGKLYELRVVNESRDWESGIVDSYDMEICLLPEDEQP